MAKSVLTSSAQEPPTFRAMFGSLWRWGARTGIYSGFAVWLVLSGIVNDPAILLDSHRDGRFALAVCMMAGCLTGIFVGGIVAVSLFVAQHLLPDTIRAMSPFVAASAATFALLVCVTVALARSVATHMPGYVPVEWYFAAAPVLWAAFFYASTRALNGSLEPLPRRRTGKGWQSAGELPRNG